ncbi:MAG: glycoside hydrolase family 3 N-terminal domain-containing protein [bacterium]|nr:glycoside hydrolase family 3 N-terminal domain-containing protein [bacterium]
MPLKISRWIVLCAVCLWMTTAAAAQDAPYRDSALPVAERVEDLLARMTTDEKIGQITLIEKNSLTPGDVTALFIGGVLSGGGGYPAGDNTPEGWIAMVRGFQEAALQTRLGIPLIYGVDAVHGHNNLRGAVIFPHNIGLGAGRNPALVEQIAQITAQEIMATGIYWNYAPVLAVPQDIRWGRTYEGFAENTALVTELAAAYLRGLQGRALSDPGGALATIKHYVGDGGAAWGTSDRGADNIDRGVTDIDEAALRAVHLPPYIEAIDQGAMSVMVSFSSWGGLRMHAQTYLITDVLKGELGFEGFVVSDWGGVDEIDPQNYYNAVVTAINAGIDMNMVPYDAARFIDVMQTAIANGDIPMARLDDAVRRILRVKFEMGLFDQPFETGDPSLIGADAHRAIARQAVRESLVLLKNADQTLPLAADARTIFVAGDGANDIGLQSGGWTIEWQGGVGAITDGTTILQGIQAAAPGADVIYSAGGTFRDQVDAAGAPLMADVGIVILAERPYAEWEGDDADLRLDGMELRMLRRMRERSERLVVILLSGRPLIVGEALTLADAFVAAWLPGSEGGGVADVLFGDHAFTGRLPYTWPRTIDQLPFDAEALNAAPDNCDAPLFPYAYGLAAEDTGSAWLDLALTCEGA